MALVTTAEIQAMNSGDGEHAVFYTPEMTAKQQAYNAQTAAQTLEADNPGITSKVYSTAAEDPLYSQMNGLISSGGGTDKYNQLNAVVDILESKYPTEGIKARVLQNATSNSGVTSADIARQAAIDASTPAERAAAAASGGVGTAYTSQKAASGDATAAAMVSSGAWQPGTEKAAIAAEAIGISPVVSSNPAINSNPVVNTSKVYDIGDMSPKSGMVWSGTGWTGVQNVPGAQMAMARAGYNPLASTLGGAYYNLMNNSVNEKAGRYYGNELQKSLENYVELSSAYHNWGQKTGLPVAANPYEYAGDIALAILKGVDPKSKSSVYGETPSLVDVPTSYAPVYGQALLDKIRAGTAPTGYDQLNLPNSMGTQDVQFNSATGYDKNGKWNADYSGFAPAISKLQSVIANKEMGVYGSIPAPTSTQQGGETRKLSLGEQQAIGIAASGSSLTAADLKDPYVSTANLLGFGAAGNTQASQEAANNLYASPKTQGFGSSYIDTVAPSVRSASTNSLSELGSTGLYIVPGTLKRVENPVGVSLQNEYYYDLPAIGTIGGNFATGIHNVLTSENPVVGAFVLNTGLSSLKTFERTDSIMNIIGQPVKETVTLNTPNIKSAGADYTGRFLNEYTGSVEPVGTSKEFLNYPVTQDVKVGQSAFGRGSGFVSEVSQSYLPSVPNEWKIAANAISMTGSPSAGPAIWMGSQLPSIGVGAYTGVREKPVETAINYGVGIALGEVFGPANLAIEKLGTSGGARKVASSALNIGLNYVLPTVYAADVASRSWGKPEKFGEILGTETFPMILGSSTRSIVGSIGPLYNSAKNSAGNAYNSASDTIFSARQKVAGITRLEPGAGWKNMYSETGGTAAARPQTPAINRIGTARMMELPSVSSAIKVEEPISFLGSDTSILSSRRNLGRFLREPNEFAIALDVTTGKIVGASPGKIGFTTPEAFSDVLGQAKAAGSENIYLLHGHQKLGSTAGVVLEHPSDIDVMGAPLWKTYAKENFGLNIKASGVLSEEGISLYDVPNVEVGKSYSSFVNRNMNLPQELLGTAGKEYYGYEKTARGKALAELTGTTSQFISFPTPEYRFPTFDVKIGGEYSGSWMPGSRVLFSGMKGGEHLKIGEAQPNRKELSLGGTTNAWRSEALLSNKEMIAVFNLDTGQVISSSKSLSGHGIDPFAFLKTVIETRFKTKMSDRLGLYHSHPGDVGYSSFFMDAGELPTPSKADIKTFSKFSSGSPKTIVSRLIGRPIERFGISSEGGIIELSPVKNTDVNDISKELEETYSLISGDVRNSVRMKIYNKYGLGPKILGDLASFDSKKTPPGAQILRGGKEEAIGNVPNADYNRGGGVGKFLDTTPSGWFKPAGKAASLNAQIATLQRLPVSDAARYADLEMMFAQPRPLLEATTSKALIVPSDILLSGRTLTDTTVGPAGTRISQVSPSGRVGVLGFDVGANVKTFEGYTTGPRSQQKIERSEDVFINPYSGETTVIGKRLATYNPPKPGAPEFEFYRGKMNIYNLPVFEATAGVGIPKISDVSSASFRKGMFTSGAFREKGMGGKVYQNQYLYDFGNEEFVETKILKQTSEASRAISDMLKSNAPEKLGVSGYAITKAPHVRKVSTEPVLKFTNPIGRSVQEMAAKYIPPVRTVKTAVSIEPVVSSGEQRMAPLQFKTVAPEEMRSTLIQSMFSEFAPRTQKKAVSVAERAKYLASSKKQVERENKIKFAEADQRMNRLTYDIPTEPIVDTTQSRRISNAMFGVARKQAPLMALLSTEIARESLSTKKVATAVSGKAKYYETSVLSIPEARNLDTLFERDVNSLDDVARRTETEIRPISGTGLKSATIPVSTTISKTAQITTPDQITRPAQITIPGRIVYPGTSLPPETRPTTKPKPPETKLPVIPILGNFQPGGGTGSSGTGRGKRYREVWGYNNFGFGKNTNPGAAMPTKRVSSASKQAPKPKIGMSLPKMGEGLLSPKKSVVQISNPSRALRSVVPKSLVAPASQPIGKSSAVIAKKKKGKK